MDLGLSPCGGGEGDDDSSSSFSTSYADQDGSVGTTFMAGRGQSSSISRVADSLCSKGDISRLLSLLHHKTMDGWTDKAQRPISLVLIDGTCIPSVEGISLVLKQLANFCSRETRFVFFHSDDDVLTSAKAEIRNTLDRIIHDGPPREVRTMYWIRKAINSTPQPSSTTFSEINDQVGVG